MCINVACCADVTVTEPLLNLLQAHAIGIEQTGTTMAQIVKAHLFAVCPFQYLLEPLADIAGVDGLVRLDAGRERRRRRENIFLTPI